MKSILMTIVGIVAGMILAFVLVIGVEGFSAIVHPLPADFKGTMDEMCQHVARYPHWVLGVVVLLWGRLPSWLCGSRRESVESLRESWSLCY